MATHYANITKHNIKLGDEILYIVDDFDAPKTQYHGTIVAINNDDFVFNVPEISDHLTGFYNDSMFKKIK